MTSRALSKKEIKRLKAAAAMAGKRETLIVLLGMTSGLRAGEIACLNNGDIFDSRGRVRSRFSLGRARTKTKKTREVFLHPEAIKAIGEYFSEKKLFKPEQPLLEGQRGRKNMAPNTICQIIKGLFVDADIDNNSSHALRKTCGTFLRKNGVDLALIQDVLGHSGSIQVTKRYLGITDTEISSAISNLRF
jgi:integrase